MKFFWQDGAVAIRLAALVFCVHSILIFAQTNAPTANGKTTDSAAPRALKDPSMIGSCWQLERNPEHPERPGRWLREPMRESCDSIHDQRTSAGSQASQVRTHARPVIRSGDQLTLEENSKLIEARLQAVALESAVQGGILAVRLRTTGNVVRAVALAPGRAEFANESGAKP
jgi:flagellar basal body P-ring formation chaperone FlgA